MAKTYVGILEVEQSSSLPNLRSTRGGFGFESTTPKYWDGTSWNTFSGTGSGITSWDGLYSNDKNMTISGAAVSFDLTSTTSNGLELTGGATSTGNVIDITNAGSGSDIDGTSSTWSISKAGSVALTAITGSATDTAITIDANGTGKVTIAGTSTGAIELQSNITSAASKSLTMAGVDGSNILVVTAGDVSVANGSITIVDGDNAASLSLTNNTITSGDLISITSTSLTTGNGLLMTANGLTNGNMISLVTTAAGFGSGTYLKAYDGAATFSIAADMATTIATAVNSTAALTVSGIQTSQSMVVFDNASGVQASDTALLLLDAGGAVASGGNLLRIAPTGTPNAGAIAVEYVGASKTCQAMYLDGDPTGVDLAHINCGGALTDGFAVLGLTNDGNLATGGSILNLTMGGTPHTAANALEIAAAKDAQAIVVASSAATNHAVQIAGAGAVADNKAVLYVSATGTPAAAGSNIVRIDGSSMTATNAPIALEIVANGKDLVGLVIDSDSATYDAVSINCGGALATGKAAFKLTADGTPAAADSYLANIDYTGATFTNNPVAVRIASKGTASTMQITDSGAIANNAAVLEVLATGTPANAGSNVVRIDASGCTATNKPIMLELVGTGKDVSGMYSVSDNTTTHGVSIAGAGALNAGRMLLVTNTGTPAANTDAVAEITFGGTATNNPIVLSVNNGTANACPLKVVSNVATATRATAIFVQDSTTGANYPLELQQDDVDQAILKITADAAGSGKTIDSDDKSGGTAVYVKIMIGATPYWIKATPGA